MLRAGARARLVAGWVGLAASAALIAATITAIHRAMRDLMIPSGGACASGGPYEVANQCSDGQAILLSAGTPVLIVACALHWAFTG